MYLTPCKQTPFKGKTYKDAVKYIAIATSERQDCAEQIEKIKEWVEKESKDIE